MPESVIQDYAQTIKKTDVFFTESKVDQMWLPSNLEKISFILMSEMFGICPCTTLRQVEYTWQWKCL